MGFLDRLKRFFRRRPPARDVSRLDAEDEQLDVTEERIDEGGPLKEHHRRLALRDERLWPKRKAAGRRRRSGYLTRQDAGRLFSATLRTRDRRLRDLLPDEEQLRRYRLPLWRTESDLAAALGLSVGELRFFSLHRQRERAPHYVTFAIPKRTGGRRLIMAPKRRLKALQRALLPLLVDRLPVSEQAHGFRRGRSVKSGAAPHVGRPVVVHLDLEDFFPTIHVGRVRGLLVALGYGYPVAAALAVLMTEAQRQPVSIDGQVFHVPVGPRCCAQGAPTSPGLSNAVALRLDRRLAGLARSLGFDYTRYADDLSFSGADTGALKRLLSLVARVVGEEGFALNRKKTRIMRAAARQTVTGVTVNRMLGLSRRERRRLRAELHQLGLAAARGTVDETAVRRARGKLAYLSMLNPEQARALALPPGPARTPSAPRAT